MARYILRRLLYSVPILVGVCLFTFFLFYVASPPEQMARRNLSAKNPTQSQIQEWLVQHGYDKTPAQQLKKHLGELFLLRFGNSDANGEPIWGRIRTGAPISFQIASLIFAASLITSIALALGVAYFRGTYVDRWGTFLCVLLLSVVYIIYIIGGQYLFGQVLRYFPLAGYRPGVGSWNFVLLPMVVGLVSGVGGSVRLYRTFMLEEMGQDYVRTARAKGVGERAVLFRHVLKNAAIPILTTSVQTIPFLFTGSLLLESFFGIPGLGSYTVDAINSADFAVVRAMVFLGALLTILGYVLTDIAYVLVDPRVRLE